MEGVVRTNIYSLGILLIPGIPTESDIKTQCGILVIIYHTDKHDPTSTGMTPYQAEEHFNKINNDYEYFRSHL